MLITLTEGRFVGEAAALTAAFLWAAATLMFGTIGKQLSPLVLNIVKGLFAIALILITLLVTAQAQSTNLSATVVEPSPVPIKATIYLLLSGAIGIGLGDTAYFSTINKLGARRALLLETLAPPVATVLAFIFLSESLSVTAVAGIGLTLAGVAWVISERVPGTTKEQTQEKQTQSLSDGWPSGNWLPGNWPSGAGVALLAVFSQATGAVLSRAALANTTVDPLWSSLLRLLAGLFFMCALALFQPHQLGAYRSALPMQSVSDVAGKALPSWQIRWHYSLKALKRPALLGGVALAAFFGTYLGIWLQQISLKYSEAGIAQALLATSPLFVLPMAAMLGDRISLRSILGAAVALSGVWILLAN